jgi:hypothetical protein
VTGERLRRLVRVVAWLLTPLVAWAASFLGGWLGAVIAGGSGGREGLLGLGTGAVIGGVVGVAGWVLFLRRRAAADRAATAAVARDEPT